MNLENNLRHALRRESPAPGFSSRVLDRIATERPVRRTFAWGRAVAAGIMFVALGGGWVAHHEMERRAGERARDEALMALRIASSKIHQAQDEVRSITARQND
jgi:hypothetical protein